MPLTLAEVKELWELKSSQAANLLSLTLYCYNSRELYFNYFDGLRHLMEVTGNSKGLPELAISIGFPLPTRHIVCDVCCTIVASSNRIQFSKLLKTNCGSCTRKHDAILDVYVLGKLAELYGSPISLVEHHIATILSKFNPQFIASYERKQP